jgi:hypothetical protein
MTKQAKTQPPATGDDSSTPEGDRLSYVKNSELSTSNEKPQSWVFTFSFNSAFQFNYAELYGLHDETREEMFRLFSDRWAFQYPSRMHAGVERFDLEKLDLRDETPMDSEHFRKVHDAD